MSAARWYLLKEVGKAAALTKGHLDVEVRSLLPRPVVGHNVGVLWEGGHCRHFMHAPALDSLSHQPQTALPSQDENHMFRTR